MPKKKNTKNGKWNIPEDASKYFDPHYDDEFKAKHPILYWLTVVGIIVLVLVGPFIYMAFASKIRSSFDGSFEIITVLVGIVSSFGISLGACNLFMIVHKQYLGHYVTLISFAIGIVGSALSLLLLWII